MNNVLIAEYSHKIPPGAVSFSMMKRFSCFQ